RVRRPRGERPRGGGPVERAFLLARAVPPRVAPHPAPPRPAGGVQHAPPVAVLPARGTDPNRHRRDPASFPPHRGVVPEVQAVARADLDHRAGQARQRPPPVSAIPPASAPGLTFAYHQANTGWRLPPCGTASSHRCGRVCSAVRALLRLRAPATRRP